MAWSGGWGKVGSGVVKDAGVAESFDHLDERLKFAERPVGLEMERAGCD